MSPSALSTPSPVRSYSANSSSSSGGLKKRLFLSPTTCARPFYWVLASPCWKLDAWSLPPLRTNFFARKIRWQRLMLLHSKPRPLLRMTRCEVHMNLWQFLLQNRMEVLDLTLEHLWLVGISTLIAVAVGVPLGILLTRRPVFNKPVLGFANVIQTVPSLALFGFLLPAPWIGERADRLVILALTLYALLPLIRNTYVGITGVDRAVVEAGRGMGMTDRQLLFQVELPLALGVIIAGIRVATVMSVGLATIAAAIGAGGLGEYIFRGLAMVNNTVILAGAIPAAMLALLADFGLGLLEKRLQRYA